jgi:hypothetical protein
MGWDHETTSLAAPAKPVAFEPGNPPRPRPWRLAWALLYTEVAPMRMWMTTRRFKLGVALALVLACNTPFIPLPPPSDPTFTPIMVSDGMGGMRTTWETRGSVMAAAKVSIFNLDGGNGVIIRAQADGTYVANPFDGKEGDRIQLHYDTDDGRESPGICRVLQRGLSQTACP